ncbi:MAG: hypothetical protein Q8L24_02810 [bacterium]|nr:hypothetical protein [bacterium]
MKILLQKFGQTLTSRQLGSEAFKAFQPVLREIGPDESLEVDFAGVLTLSPSWADEFLTPLLGQLGDRLVLFPCDNLSVQATIKLLEEINKRSFKTKQS